MPAYQEIYDKVITLVTENETEEALRLLKRTLENTPNRDPNLYHDVVILVGKYNTWEREKRRDTLSENNKELERINSRLLDIVGQMKEDGQYARRADIQLPPTMSTSPDPLRMAQPNPPATSPQPAGAVGLKGQVGNYLKGFLMVCGAILLLLFAWGIATSSDDPVPTIEDPEVVIQPAVPEVEDDGAAYLNPPVPVEEETEARPVTSSRSTRPAKPSPAEINQRMKDFVASQVGLNQSNFTPIPLALINKELGGTRWYNAGTSYIQFSSDGQTATYLNGNGAVEITNGTNLDFLAGTYLNNQVGDSGFIGIVPPQNGNTLYIYSESFVTGLFSFIEATRQ